MFEFKVDGILFFVSEKKSNNEIIAEFEKAQKGNKIIRSNKNWIWGSGALLAIVGVGLVLSSLINPSNKPSDLNQLILPSSTNRVHFSALDSEQLQPIPSDTELIQYLTLIDKENKSPREWIESYLMNHPYRLILIGQGGHLSQSVHLAFEKWIVPHIQTDFMILEGFPSEMESSLEEFNRNGTIDPIMESYLPIADNYIYDGYTLKLIQALRKRGIKIIPGGVSLISSLNEDGTKKKVNILVSLNQQIQIITNRIKMLRQNNPDAVITAFVGASHNDRVADQPLDFLPEEKKTLTVDLVDPHWYAPLDNQNKSILSRETIIRSGRLHFDYQIFRITMALATTNLLESNRVFPGPIDFNGKPGTFGDFIIFLPKPEDLGIARPTEKDLEKLGVPLHSEKKISFFSSILEFHRSA
jgi:hypothetical protein